MDEKEFASTKKRMDIQRTALSGRSDEDTSTSENIPRLSMSFSTIIGASSRSLIARGGTGGIAIWTKLENDIRPAAYGGITIS